MYQVFIHLPTIFLLLFLPFFFLSPFRSSGSLPNSVSYSLSFSTKQKIPFFPYTKYILKEKDGAELPRGPLGRVYIARASQFRFPLQLSLIQSGNASAIWYRYFLGKKKKVKNDKNDEKKKKIIIISLLYLALAVLKFPFTTPLYYITAASVKYINFFFFFQHRIRALWIKIGKI